MTNLGTSINTLHRTLALLFLLLSMSATADTGLPEPVKIAPHTWAWIGPYGPPTRENGGFRMNLGFVVGRETVAVIDSGYGSAMASAISIRSRAESTM